MIREGNPQFNINSIEYGHSSTTDMAVLAAADALDWQANVHNLQQPQLVGENIDGVSAGIDLKLQQLSAKESYSCQHQWELGMSGLPRY